jgi:hypothetical protein
VVLELRTDLVRHSFDPDGGEVEVRAEDFGEQLRLNKLLVQVPHEAVADAVCLRFELDADWDERGAARCLPLHYLRAAAQNVSVRTAEEQQFTYWWTCGVRPATVLAVINRAGGTMPR